MRSDAATWFMYLFLKGLVKMGQASTVQADFEKGWRWYETWPIFLNWDFRNWAGGKPSFENFFCA